MFSSVPIFVSLFGREGRPGRRYNQELMETVSGGAIKGFLLCIMVNPRLSAGRWVSEVRGTISGPKSRKTGL